MERKALGIATNTIYTAKTPKEKADQQARKMDNREARRRDQRVQNTIYGALTYGCSNPGCSSTYRAHEPMGERRILCSRCNQGFYTQLLRDDRKNLARPGDMDKRPQPKPKRKKRK